MSGLTPIGVKCMRRNPAAEVTLHGFAVTDAPGLAVTLNIEDFCEGRWEVTHIASGVAVLPTRGRFKSAAKAAEAARRLSPLADWTQDADVLRAIPDLKARIVAAVDA